MKFRLGFLCEQDRLYSFRLRSYKLAFKPINVTFILFFLHDKIVTRPKKLQFKPILENHQLTVCLKKFRQQQVLQVYTTKLPQVFTTSYHKFYTHRLHYV